LLSLNVYVNCELQFPLSRKTILTWLSLQVIMPALERYLQEMNEDQPQHQQQQQQQQLGIDNITVDVHNSDDATDDDSDCRQSPLDRRHSDGQRFHSPSSKLPRYRSKIPSVTSQI